jgi:hypothetical protein
MTPATIVSGILQKDYAKAQASRYFNRAFIEEASSPENPDMRVNAASPPIAFFLQPAAGEKMLVHEMSYHLSASIALPALTQVIGTSATTGGILISTWDLVDDTEVEQLTPTAILANREFSTFFKEHAGTPGMGNPVTIAGVHSFVDKMGSPLLLTPEYGIRVLIQDDLTFGTSTLTKFEMYGSGVLV